MTEEELEKFNNNYNDFFRGYMQGWKKYFVDNNKTPIPHIISTINLLNALLKENNEPENYEMSGYAYGILHAQNYFDRHKEK